ncbi:MAG: sortase, partial [Chloroflexi bacterium]|nr:sortase [Chloroflexota bacterium]
FKGKISDVRFWNTVRSSEQIYADKNKQLTGSEAGLIGYWKLDETSGVIAEDSTSNNNDGTVHGGATRVQETGSNFGGLVGLNSGTVTSSYYDSTISGQTDTGKGDPQPTSAMQTAGTFSGWDFATLWKINEGSSYPYFNRYTLSYSAGANGSLTGSASQTVSPGGTGSAVTAAPNTNYKFDKWSDNLTTATRQDANVTTSLSVSASFLEAVPPTTQSIVVADTSLIVGEASVVTFTFSEAVSGLTTADLTVGSGSLSEPSSSNGGSTWTATLTPAANTSNATNIITLNNSGVQDLAGNAGSGSTDSNNYAVDTIRPTASIVVNDTSLLAGEASPVIFIFSEAVSGLTTTDLTVGSGSLSEPVTSDGGITWAATLTPAVDTSDAANVVTLNNSGVADMAGNVGSGTTNSNTYTVNTVRPTTESIVVSDTSLIVGETSAVTFTFSEAVSGLTTTDLTVGSGSLSEPATSDGGVTWTATLTPATNTSDAANIITLNNSGVQNAVGNAGSGSTASNNYAVDTIRPTASIVVSDTSLAAGETSAVTFTFSEAVSGLSTADLTVGSGSLSEPSSSDGGITWTATLTPAADTSNATNVITLDTSGVTDMAGNAGSGTTISNTYAVNTVSPSVTVEQAVGQSDPVNTSPILFTATFSEAVTGFSAEDVSFAGSTATGTLAASISGSGPAYTVSVSGMTGPGTVVVSIPADKASNSAGNSNTASTSSDNAVTYDAAAPTLTVEKDSAQADPTSASPILFTATFSEAVTGFSAEDVSFEGSTAPGTLAASISGSGLAYTVSVSGMTGSGSVVVSILANAAADAAGNLSAASTSTDNTVVYDVSAPTVTVEQASDQSDPANTGPIRFIATFSKPVSGLTAEDVSFTGSTAPGTLTAEVSAYSPSGDPLPGGDPDPGTELAYTISVSGMTGSGLVMVSLPANAAADALGNQSDASTSSDNTVTYDVSAPTVTVEQASDQADPVNTGPIRFTAVFSENVTGFNAEDVSFVGSTAPGTLTATVSSSMIDEDPAGSAAPGADKGISIGYRYTISVSGMSGNGTVVVSIPANRVLDASSNPNAASTSTDNSVTFDTSTPEVSIPGIQVEYTGSGPASFGVNFDKPVFNPEGHSDPDDVTNPANYLLVKNGPNQLFDTLSCAEGLAPDDIQFAVSSVDYDSENNTSTIRLASRLPVGTYRLFVCGTTSIVDLAGNPINGGEDAVFDFSVRPEPESLPETGFAPGKFTTLPAQPANLAYASSGLTLSIPGLGVQTAIVGVPRSEQSWDVSWLGSRAGYLYGSAYPTWQGNTVLTGHVWDADNTPGIFANLKSLRYGDPLQILTGGQTYTYEVRENSLISARGVTQVFEPKEQDWLTLVTCESFDAEEDVYRLRRVVRAVLVSVE